MNVLSRAVVRPALRFAAVEAAGGIVMLAGAAVAIVWANSPWKAGYARFLATAVTLRVGKIVHLDLDLHGAVNEGLMTLFFLVAGLEIRRQLSTGELRDRRAAVLPALAALGGIVVPALVFAAVNHGHSGAKGWGIAVATDVAFAVGIVTLAGSRVPVGARIFVLTLAVVDDVGGIVIIALFYADDIQVAWLLVAAAVVALTVVLGRRDIRSLVPYLVLGALCWYALYAGGLTAAITGVVFGLVAPVERIENRLNAWVSFGIVPLFALTNAGVRFDVGDLDGRVVMGIVLGLVVGKTVGVFGGSWIAVRIGVGRLPNGTNWGHVLGLAVTCGIGFTVALFVADLSFTDPVLTASATIGVLAASALAGTFGFLLLRFLPRAAPSDVAPDSDG